jgi:hypothetical protein
MCCRKAWNVYTNGCDGSVGRDDWHHTCSAATPARLVMQSDGNLVLYNRMDYSVSSSVAPVIPSTAQSNAQPQLAADESPIVSQLWSSGTAEGMDDSDDRSQSEGVNAGNRV